MREEISRRRFLGAVGLGAVAWACAGGEEGGDAAAPTPTATTPAYSVVPATTELAVGDSRLAVAVFGPDKTPIRFSEDAEVSARLVPEGGEAITATPEIVTVRRGPGGDEHEHEEDTEVQKLVVVRHGFEDSGIWDMTLTFPTEEGERSADLTFQVIAQSPTVMIGQEAKAVDSPTTDEPMGVDPVCTRTPPCTMHSMTIAEAVESAKPSVVLFATPRWCTSRTCGPVVDILEAEKQRVGESIDFVHVEIWKDADSVNNYPDGAVQAFVDYGLQAEPFVFFVDSDGVVRERWSGAWGIEETRKTIDALAAGEL